jgi:hypothetical protein
MNEGPTATVPEIDKVLVMARALVAFDPADCKQSAAGEIAHVRARERHRPAAFIDTWTCTTYPDGHAWYTCVGSDGSARSQRGRPDAEIGLTLEVGVTDELCGATRGRRGDDGSDAGARRRTVDVRRCGHWRGAGSARPVRAVRGNTHLASPWPRIAAEPPTALHRQGRGEPRLARPEHAFRDGSDGAILAPALVRGAAIGRWRAELGRDPAPAE